ncbi:hypothetical protein FRC10_009654 [Ceratobasidium sp. 414]|nr:hypothetical protein FRC10_009654 [Ceratobasidium sp. 414]
MARTIGRLGLRRGWETQALPGPRAVDSALKKKKSKSLRGVGQDPSSSEEGFQGKSLKLDIREAVALVVRYAESTKSLALLMYSHFETAREQDEYKGNGPTTHEMSLDTLVDESEFASTRAYLDAPFPRQNSIIAKPINLQIERAAIDAIPKPPDLEKQQRIAKHEARFERANKEFKQRAVRQCLAQAPDSNPNSEQKTVKQGRGKVRPE